MKKVFNIIWGGIIIVIALIFLSVFALIFVPQWVNDMALTKFEKEVMENFAVPESTEMIEHVSGCGNSSGTGDHTELYVAILIKSNLHEDDIKAYYKEDGYYWRTWSTAKAFDGTTIGMDCMNLKFDTDIGEAGGYYILEYFKSAPLSWLDIRGM